MSSTLLLDLPDRLREFQQLLERCRLTLVETVIDGETVAGQIDHLENHIHDYFLALPAELLPVQRRQKWLSIQTELRRTLRLLATELIFWRSARSPERRQHYQNRLLAHYQQLQAFSNAMQEGNFLK
ncbi:MULTISPECIES: hypothetical protein [unclassified Synechocystis]|uniref:hypothetical protein n=1 Tax=unclassified Synechocystis TaxID=2640012 RepID=UPI000425F908|nr:MULTISPECIES: hypothetical protein [unclassified Synechocystis]AIE75779.1 hypothetical protein D082_32510 [Synechocystis sp. PCC 6714]MCT0255285.1 hypothetical protein [Synechocystis sp. CS-94]